MDLNLIVIAGTLAAPPEHRSFDSGSHLARYLITVRSEEPTTRVDVIPVTHWDPPDDDDLRTLEAGDRIWVAGAVQRRFWSAPDGRRSRLEVVAHQVQATPPETGRSPVPATLSGRPPSDDLMARRPVRR